MQRVNAFAFYTLAKHLKPLDSFQQNATYGDLVWLLANARWQVQELLASNVVPLRICRHAAEALIGAISDVIPIDLTQAFDQAEQLKHQAIDWWRLNAIKEAASRFETVLAEELNVLDTYSVKQKGVYATPELIANADLMIPAPLRVKLPPQAVFDLREAGKCLAFETPTASAFHLLRAVEAMLLLYYVQVIGGVLPPRMRNWGVYINNLRKSGHADEKILEFLDHIRQNYRNPVSHPEVSMTTDDMVVLFGVATAAIVQIAQALPDPANS